jgi:hypothetical protein
MLDSRKMSEQEGHLMGNNKSTIPIFLTVLFLLFIFTGFPGTSISADEVTDKED